MAAWWEGAGQQVKGLAEGAKSTATSYSLDSNLKSRFVPPAKALKVSNDAVKEWSCMSEILSDDLTDNNTERGVANFSVLQAALLRRQNRSFRVNLLTHTGYMYTCECFIMNKILLWKWAAVLQTYKWTINKIIIINKRYVDTEHCSLH